MGEVLREEDVASLEQDSRSLIQLLQNNQELNCRRHGGESRRRLITPLGMSVLIIYGIVGILILHLSITSYLKSSKDLQSQMVTQHNTSYIGELQKIKSDVSKLQTQNIYLTGRYRFMDSSVNDSLLLEKEYRRLNVDQLQNSTSKLIEIMKKALQNFNLTLSQSELQMESRILSKISQKMTLEIQHLSLNQSILRVAKESPENSSLSKNFFSLQQQLFDIFGSDEKETQAILTMIRNNMKRNITSCQEYQKLGITSDGFYRLNLGNSPQKLSTVKVFCNFTSNSTYIFHDKMEGMNVTACSGTDCFQYNITYFANVKQIRTLIDGSLHCEQSFKFRCLHAPLDNYGAWYGFSGRKQTYFTGTYPGEHRCECFNSTSGCSGLPSVNKCNCDASSTPFWLEDKGVITDAWDLPISRFTYGHLFEGGGQQAFVQIGPLICLGRKEIDSSNSIPDMWVPPPMSNRVWAVWRNRRLSSNGITQHYSNELLLERGLYAGYCQSNRYSYNSCDFWKNNIVYLSDKKYIQLESLSYFMVVLLIN